MNSDSQTFRYKLGRTMELAATDAGAEYPIEEEYIDTAISLFLETMPEELAINSPGVLSLAHQRKWGEKGVVALLSGHNACRQAMIERIKA